MPIFDYHCSGCDVVREQYVSRYHVAPKCEDCGRAMKRQKFTSGTRSVFDVKGWNAHNGYGLRWKDNPHDIKMRGLT